MRTNVENAFNFPGWAQRLGTGSISWRARTEFGISQSFWLQSLRIKRVTITLGDEDIWNSFGIVRNIRPDPVRNFILSNVDAYTELTVIFTGRFAHNNLQWNPHNHNEQLSLNGKRMKKLTIIQNGMNQYAGNKWGRGAYEAFQGYDAVITEFR